MIKLITASILTLFSTNVLALQEQTTNEIDMFSVIILSIPLIILLAPIFFHYKNNKKITTKKSYASTNIIVEQNKYQTPVSNLNKNKSRNSLDAIPNIEVSPSTTSRVASAVVVEDIISDDGEMSGGGSSFDFDWD